MTEQKRLIPVFLIILLIFGCISANGQTLEESLIKDMEWRNIGPANTNGRISDIEALDSDFAHVLVGSASGGVWLSTNAGTTWTPIFDNYGSASIGDVAFFQKNPEIIWVGTGEKNCRNSVAWGDGIYKSTDGGKSFTNMGLKDSHSIGRIVTHPTNPDIVYAAAIGHVWGYSGIRGLYKTTDGGNSWQKLINGLPDDVKTGAIEVVMHPNNPDILFAGFWQRIRRAYRFESGGPNGGIFKSTDAGKSWKKLTKGLPEGDTGKIGMAIFYRNPNIIMAIIEHGFQPPQNKEDGFPNPDYTDMTKLGSGIYRSEDGGETWTYVNRRNNRPFYYSHIYINPRDDKLVYVLDTDLNVSHDGGHSFEVLGINAYLRSNTPQGIHGDYHCMWFDPYNKNRFYIGDDGGVALTHDHENYIYFDNFCVAQFYAVSADMRQPYWVYGGLQDHATWGGPSRTRDRGILTDHWFRIFGGDGFHTQVDPENWRTLYFESQQGAISRMNIETREAQSIRPNMINVINWKDVVTKELIQQQKDKGWGNNPFRFNWSSPIVLSPHNSRTVYLGGNFLFKSIDRGDHWKIISPDLSKNDPEKTLRESGGLTNDVTGAENYGTIIAISESPIRADLIWVGTDDGNVQITRDGGTHWSNVRYNILGVPDDLWVSRVEASHFDESTAYLSFDGHRSDNFQPWVFKTTDYGETWLFIGDMLPDGQPVYVIKEDLENPDLLFVGTEFAVFYSIDGGEQWTKLNQNMPTVAVHDLLIHPRENDLIAATHGRGIWILDDISTLQALKKDVIESDVFLFNPHPSILWHSVQRGGNRGHLYYEAQNPPDEAIISFYLSEDTVDQVKLIINDIFGEQSRMYHLSGKKGITRIGWDRYFDPSERRKKGFVASVKYRIKQEEKGADPNLRKNLENIKLELDQAGLELDKLLQVQDELRELFPSRFIYRDVGRGQLQGEPAGPGEYLITLIVGEKSMSVSLLIKPDPMED